MREPEPTICRKCGGELRLVLQPPHIVGDIQPYKSIVTGEMITSRDKHREHLKRNGLTEVGDQKPKWMRDREEQART